MTQYVNKDVIKKPSHKDTYTDGMKSELIKCQLDAFHFIENYVKIQHPIKGAIPFKMFEYQKVAVNNFLNYKDNILLISRQMGKTTVVMSYILWFAMFKPDKTVLIVGNSLKTAIEIMDRIKYAYKEVPDHIRDAVVEFNKTSISFKNGSKIVCRATGPDSARGLSPSIVFCMGGESTVNLRNKNTGEVLTMTLEDVYTQFKESHDRELARIS